MCDLWVSHLLCEPFLPQCFERREIAPCLAPTPLTPKMGVKFKSRTLFRTICASTPVLTWEWMCLKTRSLAGACTWSLHLTCFSTLSQSQCMPGSWTAALQERVLFHQQPDLEHDSGRWAYVCPKTLSTLSPSTTNGVGSEGAGTNLRKRHGLARC